MHAPCALIYFVCHLQKIEEALSSIGEMMSSHRKWMANESAMINSEIRGYANMIMRQWLRFQNGMNSVEGAHSHQPASRRQTYSTPLPSALMKPRRSSSYVTSNGIATCEYSLSSTSVSSSPSLSELPRLLEGVGSFGVMRS